MKMLIIHYNKKIIYFALSSNLNMLLFCSELGSSIMNLSVRYLRIYINYIYKRYIKVEKFDTFYNIYVCFGHIVDVELLKI